MTRHGRPAWRREPVRLVVAALVALCAILVGAPPASAHAQLTGTDPVDGAVLEESPQSVTLTFNEPVRLTDREITLYDAEGRELESSASSSGTEVTVDLPDLDRGTVVVAWFVVSADGHPISGSLTFSVGERSASVADPPPPPTSSGVVRAAQATLAALQYVGLLVAAGLAVFVALVLPTSFTGDRVRAAVRGVVRVAAGLAAAAALLLVPVSAAYAQGEELGSALGGFDPGLVTHELVAAALLVIGLGIVVAVIPSRPPAGRARILLLSGAGLAVLAPAVVGHTRSYQPTALLVTADVVHVAAASVWLGGLVGLVLALRALAGRGELAALTLARFSTLAGALLVAVAAAGAVLSWRILGSWSGFVETGYGVLLLVKIGLVLVVAGVGAWNRLVMLPRVRSAVGFADLTAVSGRVTRTAAIEAGVIVVLLGVTGALVNASPRPAPVDVPAGQTGVEEGSVGELEVFAVMSPRRQGANTLLVQVQDADGEPVTPLQPPQVSVRSGAVDLGDVDLINTDSGTYRADVVLPRPGTWEVQVSLRLSRFESPVSTVRFEVEPEE